MIQRRWGWRRFRHLDTKHISCGNVHRVVPRDEDALGQRRGLSLRGLDERVRLAVRVDEFTIVCTSGIQMERFQLPRLAAMRNEHFLRGLVEDIQQVTFGIMVIMRQKNLLEC